MLRFCLLCHPATYVWLFGGLRFSSGRNFGTRFNFIAVDYLNYAQEVISNIRESYPLYPILALGGITLSLAWCWQIFKTSSGLAGDAPVPDDRRSFDSDAFSLMRHDRRCHYPRANDGQAVREIAKNGTMPCFPAYRNNELDFGVYGGPSESGVHMRQLLEEARTIFLNKIPKTSPAY